MTLPGYQANAPDGRRKYLTARENERFLKAASALPERERLLCETLYYLGCRISEALNLTLDDVETDDLTVRIFCLKKRGREVIRRIPVPQALVKGLQGLAQTCDGRLWLISRTTAWRIVKRVMHAAGITGLQATCKGLRHGFGVRAALAKLPVGFIQRCMGHANIATTSIYLDVKDDEARELLKLTWGVSEITAAPERVYQKHLQPSSRQSGGGLLGEDLQRDLRIIADWLLSLLHPEFSTSFC